MGDAFFYAHTRIDVFVNLHKIYLCENCKIIIKMAQSDSKTILKLMFLLFPILFVSCNNETNDTMPDLEGNLLVNDFGVIKELTKDM